MTTTAAEKFATGSFKFLSESGRTYTMTITNRGRGQHIECSCPGHRRWFHCKHVDDAKSFRALPRSAKPTTTDAKTDAARTMKETYKENNMKKVKIVKKSEPKFPVGVPVNVKVEGERVMLKSVTLELHPDDHETFLVRTGRRGRPSHLSAAQIVRVRVL